MKALTTLGLFWLVALTGFPAVAQDTVPLSLNQLIQWEPPADGTIFRFEDMDLRLELIYPEDSTDFIVGADLHVSANGDGFTLHSEAGMSGFGQIGVYTIDQTGGLSIVFGAYTGGAHCCMAVQSVLLTQDEPVIADLGLYDGDLVEPRDLDGDGYHEFYLWDGRFNYAFDSYAASFTPVVIYDTAYGELRDVTMDARFYPQIKMDMQHQAEYCGGSGEWLASACASLAANAARLGRYDKVREQLADHLATGRFDSGWDEFSFCEGEACDQTRDFTDFLEALDFALQNWGYL